MSKYDNLPDLLKVEEAGKLINVGRCRAYEMSCTGEMPIVKVGHKKFVPKWELLRKFRLIETA